MNAFFAYYFCFVHFFHRIYFLGLFEFDAPDFTESSLADDVLAIEVIPGDLLALEN